MPLILIYTFFCAPFLWAQKSWPSRYSPNPSLAKYLAVKTDDGTHQYETKHFYIQSPIELHHELIKEFSLSVEATYDLISKFPLPLFAPPENDKPLIALLSEEDFIKAGGLPGAAGMCLYTTPTIIIQKKFFFPELRSTVDTEKRRTSHAPFSRTPRKRKKPLSQKKNFPLIVHELTHLLMARQHFHYPTWFWEGIPEYFAVAYQSKGNFIFTQIDTRIRDYIFKRFPARPAKVKLTSVKKTLQLKNSQDWMNHLRSRKDQSEFIRPYTTALLLIHYQIHGGKTRRETLQSQFESFDPSQRVPLSFLKDEDAAQIQKQLIEYWGPKGLHLEFINQ